MRIEAIPTPGLGNMTYLVAAAGEAAAIDLPRDAWRVEAAAAARGWRLTHVLETHVHNDYLSGAKELRRAAGARVVAPAAGRYRFAHEPAVEGSVVELGDVALVARATPGHTPEHLAWEARDGTGRPTAVFTGGSLLVGGVGRTDLLGPRRTAELSDAQFRTLRRLAELPDDVLVHPTHGAGSFCVAGSADGPASASMGALRRANPALATTDRQAFERILEAGRTRYPAYYRRMAPINRRGPRLVGRPPRPPELDGPGLRDALADGAWLVDVRDREAFAAAHPTGALSIGLDEAFAAYVGWLAPFDAPIALVAPDAGAAVTAATELLRIGYEHVVGRVPADPAAWADAGLEVRGYPVMRARELGSLLAREPAAAARVLDVRQPAEWREGALPGSRRVFVADLPRVVAGLDRSAPWIVGCQAGHRASIAASILDAAGVPVRLVSRGGIPSLPGGMLEPA
jgi:hydroxyacylglutathione hydrolase